MKKLLLAASMLTALALPAKADFVLGGQNWTGNGVLLTLTPVVPGGNQPTNLPCVICGDNQPQQPALLGYNNFGNTGNQTDLRFFSTSVVGGSLGNDVFGGVASGYAIGAGSPLLDALNGNTTFSVGVDSNQANGQPDQVLESFFFLDFTTQTVLGRFIGPAPIPPPNNGTGFPDYTIDGLSLAGVNVGDRVGFFARISNASDGPDSFFLEPAAVPGPIVGAGLPGLISACFGLWGFNRFRRKRQVA